MASLDMQSIHVFTVQDGKRDITAAIAEQPDPAWHELNQVSSQWSGIKAK